MALDLSKLSEAVTAVAGIAQENSQLKAEQVQAQKDVDALTASLIAATTSPAGAVGIAAVSAALVRTSFFRIDKAMSSLLFVASAGRFTGYDPG